MKISVVIPALNEEVVIASSIARAWDAGADEVIVADGGSQDNTVSTASQKRCQVIHSDLGRAAQMNAGARAAMGDALLFLHADNWLVPDGCAQIRSALERFDSCWGGFQQQIDDPSDIFRWIESGNALRSQWQGLVYGDQGLFVKRSMFESVGGFPDLPLMEDFELSRRLARIERPVLLAGPIHVSARRWKAKGSIRQTLRNWRISVAYRLGVPADRLAKWYEA